MNVLEAYDHMAVKAEEMRKSEADYQRKMKEIMAERNQLKLELQRVFDLFPKL